MSKLRCAQTDIAAGFSACPALWRSSNADVQEQQEIDWLRREVAKLKAERDILEKAAAYFAKESM